MKKASHGQFQDRVSMPDNDTPLILIIRHQLDQVLRIIDLEENGQIVSVDEIKLDLHPTRLKNNIKIRKQKPAAPVQYEKLSAFRHQEPRLILISRFLSRLKQFAEFFSQGRQADIDGFRLKNLEYWSRYVTEGVFGNLGELCSACNCDCDLCFLKGSAIDFPKKGVLSLSETKTRIRYYRKDKNLGLPTGNCQPGEPFLNPHALDILKMAREAQPDANISITTNGELLDESLIRNLAQLKPITLMISVNSADPANRQKIMKSKRAAEMVEAFPLLKKYGVQFSGSILAPADLALSDLEYTARFLDKNGAVIIRIPLPGYTRFHPIDRQFETKKRWAGIVDMTTALRQELTTPFLVCPSFYWNRNIAAHVDGVFVNSPAKRAGFEFGDRILEIDGQKIITRAEAAHLLSVHTQSGSKNIRFQRRGEIHEVLLENTAETGDDYYPFKPSGYPAGSGFMGKQYGLHFIDGFHLDDALEVFKLIEKYPDAKKVLIFTTPLVKDLFVQAVMIMGKTAGFDPEKTELKLTMAEHRFWGGNIVIGDLHVVQDYIDHLNDVKHKGYFPDLVIIPRSFADSWGFDLLGKSIMDIEKQTGFKIEIANNNRIMI